MTPTNPQYAAPPRVLVVDDTAAHRQLLELALQDGHDVSSVASAERALDWIEIHGPPDIVLLDVLMPGMDGYTLCSRFKADPAMRDVPVIFLTARGDARDEVRGLAVGAVDYIVKPAPAAVVAARVGTHLQLRHARQLLASANRELEGEAAILEAAFRGLASIGRALGKESPARPVRIQRYTELLLGRLQSVAGDVFGLTPRAIRKMAQASVLYDIGKLGMPLEILHHRGPLSSVQRVVMNTHAELGGQALQAAIGEVVAQTGEHLTAGGEYQGPLAFLAYARDMAMHHHERWDGTGYPLRLAGETIPFCARVMAVVDVYDALRCRRPHKAPWTREASAQYIRDGAGTQFDPAVVAAFSAVEPQMHDAWRDNSDFGERD